MDLSGLLGAVRQHPAYQGLLAGLADGQPQAPLGLIRAARPCLISALAADLRHPLVVISARMDHAANLAEQLLAWNPALHVLTFPEPNALFYERTPWGPRSTQARLQVLASLGGCLNSGPEPGTVIVASARGLMQRTLPPEMLRSHCLVIESGQPLPTGQPETLLRRCLQIGYEPASIVTGPGTFSRRGGILDIYPAADALPCRIELWGETVESLRVFDPATQRSLHTIPALAVTPAREALPLFGPLAASRLKGWFDGWPPPAGDDEPGPPADAEKLAGQQPFETLEFYLPWLYDEVASLLDYLPDDTLVLVEDHDELADTVADLEAQALSLREAQEAAGAIPPAMPVPLVTWAHLADDFTRLRTLTLGGALPERGPDDPLLLGDAFAPGPRFAGELQRFLDHLRDLARPARSRLIVVSRQAERLAGLWHERVAGPRPETTAVLEDVPAPGAPVFVPGGLADGWRLDGADSPTLLFTDAEIFGWQRPEPRRRRPPRAIAPEDFFADLEPGAFVVHTEYGIGRFEGLEKRILSGVEREFLIITYGGGDLLYVPIHQADRLTRYVGAEDGTPDLSRLGTPDWSRLKERTRQAVEEVARDLLDLYAVRETVAGHAFSPDTPWQAELEASFPYIETPDQLRALAEVKADMERPRPMDRLICGDVGYGKTEVALRAAFKAVMDGKQVAMLVPTTILAQQHSETFTRRLAAFPVRVEMLSRFRSRAEQDAVLAGLRAGTVDIVIGTHRLLSSDVAFQDLGLLIIDEEQRFGVTHKEQLKRMRVEMDVLTLTATPIPRTLYMGLSGVRDISIINTAPEERLPVRTSVGRRDDDLIRQAILRELDRGGQVFYVHNRVQTIYSEQARLQRLVPEAALAVAHGQMAEAELEGVMARFAGGEIDVLLTTSIIEAGLDFPTANTLIVDRADRFGLSQLYQLRGRVGRSANRAFAYFFHPPAGQLTPEARARLETLAEYSDLGAGFNIAMRDLEIRGTGDILGLRQSGHIAAVGFHLYTQMLAQAVRRLRAEREDGPPAGEESPASDLQRSITIDLPLPTFIPTDYVPDMALRIQLYRRMADLSNADAIRDLGVELADRFGPLPPPVENLLYQLRVKLLALEAGAESVVAEGQQIAIRCPGLNETNRRLLQGRLGHGVRVSRTAVWLSGDGSGWEESLIGVLERLAAVCAAQAPA